MNIEQIEESITALRAYREHDRDGLDGYELEALCLLTDAAPSLLAMARAVERLGRARAAMRAVMDGDIYTATRDNYNAASAEVDRAEVAIWNIADSLADAAARGGG